MLTLALLKFKNKDVFTERSSVAELALMYDVGTFASNIASLM